jgi:hypothetical protein
MERRLHLVGLGDAVGSGGHPLSNQAHAQYLNIAGMPKIILNLLFSERQASHLYTESRFFFLRHESRRGTI